MAIVLYLWSTADVSITTSVAIPAKSAVFVKHLYTIASAIIVHETRCIAVAAVHKISTWLRSHPGDICHYSMLGCEKSYEVEQVPPTTVVDTKPRTLKTNIYLVCYQEERIWKCTDILCYACWDRKPCQISAVDLLHFCSPKILLFRVVRHVFGFPLWFSCQSETAEDTYHCSMGRQLECTVF